MGRGGGQNQKQGYAPPPSTFVNTAGAVPVQAAVVVTQPIQVQVPQGYEGPPPVYGVPPPAYAIPSGGYLGSQPPPAPTANHPVLESWQNFQPPGVQHTR